MLLWSRIARCLEITQPNHHLEEPYNVDDIFEAGKWILKGTDTGMSTPRPVAAPGVLPVPATAIAPLLTPLPADCYVKKEDLDTAIAATIASTMTCIETMITTSLTTSRTTTSANNLCHFCGEVSHTMTRGCCPTLENYIRQGCIHQAADGKVVLPSSAIIPNYPELKSYQEHVDEWHCRNPGNLATSTLTSNTNSDTEQAMQQQMVLEVMHLDTISNSENLTKDACIENLERKLASLKNQVFDGVEIKKPK